jgi:hypothetical protein
MAKTREQVATDRAARGARVAEVAVQITRATIYIGAPFIGDDNGTWVPYTAAVEVNNRALRGKSFSGQMPFPAGRTQVQRRAALQTIMQQDGPGQFPEGSTVASNLEIDWIGI